MQFPLQVDHRRTPSGARWGAANLLLVSTVVFVGLIAGTWLAFANTSPSLGDRGSVRANLEETRAPGDPVVPSNSTKESGSRKFPVTIRRPAGPPRVFTGVNDIHGQPVTVACSTCHATRKPNPENKSVADMNEFHGSLAFSHGTVSCLSCHNSTDYEALKLADGTRVEFTNVMTLCAQCHGPQMRDYEHGVHGGFNGHWDLTRGPREKNNCIDCHNPHSPQFPKMQPSFKPRDRFLEKIEDH